MLPAKVDYDSKQKCIEILENLKWGRNKNVKCSHCNSERINKRKNTIKWHCNNCNKDFTVLYNSIFENTRMSLNTYFDIIYFMMHSKFGISAKSISRKFQLNYKSAWYCAMRIRCAMMNETLRQKDELKMVEIYETITSNNKKSKVQTLELSIILSNAIGFLETKIFNTPIISDLYEFEDVLTCQSKKSTKAKKFITIEDKFWDLLKGRNKKSFKSVSKKYLNLYLAEFLYKYHRQQYKENSFNKLLYYSLNTKKLLLNYKLIEE